MTLESPQKVKEELTPEKLKEFEEAFSALDQAAAHLGIKLENSNWVSVSKENAGALNSYEAANLEIIKGIVYGCIAALTVDFVTGSKDAAWVVGSLVGIEKFTNALRYLSGQLPLKVLKEALQLAKQDLNKRKTV